MFSAIHQIQKKKRKLVKDAGGKILWGLESIIDRYSLVPTTPLLDPCRFQWTKRLERNWRTIRRELEQVLAYNEIMPNFQDISKDQMSISDDNNWKTYFFYGFGYKAEENCARCPETTRLIEEIPGMITAFFSILKPGKHIPEHRGVFKGILRYHLGLKVPESRKNCWFRIDNSMTHWEEVKSLLFDVTYRHEVKNETGETRVVLLIDVVRPLRFPGSWLNHALISLVRHSGYVQDARKNQEMWERKFKKYLNKQPKSELQF